MNFSLFFQIYTFADVNASRYGAKKRNVQNNNYFYFNLGHLPDAIIIQDNQKQSDFLFFSLFFFVFIHLILSIQRSFIYCSIIYTFMNSVTCTHWMYRSKIQRYEWCYVFCFSIISAHWCFTVKTNSKHFQCVRPVQKSKIHFVHTAIRHVSAEVQKIARVNRRASDYRLFKWTTTKMICSEQTLIQSCKNCVSPQKRCRFYFKIKEKKNRKK